MKHKQYNDKDVSNLKLMTLNIQKEKSFTNYERAKQTIAHAFPQIEFRNTSSMNNMKNRCFNHYQRNIFDDKILLDGFVK